MYVTNSLYPSEPRVNQTGAVRTTPCPRGDKSFQMQLQDSLTRTAASSTVHSNPDVDRALEKLVNGKAPISEKDLNYLAEKYDATNMTGEEYKAFTNDLQERGILSRWECLAVDGELRLADFAGALASYKHWPYQIYTEPKCGFGDNFSQGWGGNALAWTRYHSGVRAYCDNLGGYDMNWNAAVFTVVHSILEQMDAVQHPLSEAV